LRDADLQPPGAAHLLRELGKRDPNTTDRVRRVVALLPSLSNLEHLLVEQDISVRKAEGVLVLLLEAIAKRPIQSGLMGSVQHGTGRA
jgi:hypothetical protein